MFLPGGLRKRRPPANDEGGARPLLWCGYYHHAIPEVFRACCPLYCPSCPSATAAPTRTAGRRARPRDFAALNLAGLCAVVPYAHELAWAGDSTFIPKSGRKLPGVGYRWHSGEAGWPGAGSTSSCRSRAWTSTVRNPLRFRPLPAPHPPRPACRHCRPHHMPKPHCPRPPGATRGPCWYGRPSSPRRQVCGFQPLRFQRQQSDCAPD